MTGNLLCGRRRGKLTNKNRRTTQSLEVEEGETGEGDPHREEVRPKHAEAKASTPREKTISSGRGATAGAETNGCGWL